MNEKVTIPKRDGVYWREDIISAFRKVHGDKYDYSLLEEKYTNLKTKISIICHEKYLSREEHGIFPQPIERHIAGRNCPKCMGRNVVLSDTEIIARAKAVHDNKYEYIGVERDEKNTPFIIGICHYKDENGVEHGQFKQSYQHHVNGKQDCPKCRYVKSSAAIRRSFELVIEKAREVHGDAYDYSLITNYKNDRIPYPIRCIKHNYVFSQNFNNHIHFKEGCPICGREKSAVSRRYTLGQWIDLAEKKHHGKYGYDRVHETFDAEDGQVWIFCKKHQKYFKQRKTNHLFGQGCPICKESKLEIEIGNFLNENNITFIRQHSFPWLVNKRELSLDFYLPDYNIAIECQGKQHFRSGGWTDKEEEYLEIEKRDSLKKELCKVHGIKLLYYSNLNIEYPYKVFEDKDKLLVEIKKVE